MANRIQSTSRRGHAPRPRSSAARGSITTALILIMFLILLTLVAAPVRGAASEAVPLPTDLYATELPEWRDPIRAATGDHLDRYQTEARFYPEMSAISGIARVAVHSRGDAPMREVIFRLWAHDPFADGRGIRINKIRLPGGRIGATVCVASSAG